MHLPELALRGRDLGGLRGGLGVGKEVAARVRAKHEPDIRHARQQLLDVRVGGAAERAREVSVLDQRDVGRRRPPDVVARADRLGQQRRVALVEVTHGGKISPPRGFVHPPATAVEFAPMLSA